MQFRVRLVMNTPECMCACQLIIPPHEQNNEAPCWRQTHAGPYGHLARPDQLTVSRPETLPKGIGGAGDVPALPDLYCVMITEQRARVKSGWNVTIHAPRYEAESHS